jgi:hypothetical protein
LDHAQTDRLKTVLLGIGLEGLLAGRGLQFSGRTDLAQKVWFAGVVPVLAALVIEIIRRPKWPCAGLPIARLAVGPAARLRRACALGT